MSITVRGGGKHILRIGSLPACDDVWYILLESGYVEGSRKTMIRQEVP